MPKGISIEQFCSRNKVPYNILSLAEMKNIKDICAAYFEGYFYAKITEQFITSKIQSIDLDDLKKTAVECMKDYIEHSNYSTEEKENLKNNYEHWADVTLNGIKQRLRDNDKLHE